MFCLGSISHSVRTKLVLHQVSQQIIHYFQGKWVKLQLSEIPIFVLIWRETDMLYLHLAGIEPTTALHGNPHFSPIDIEVMRTGNVSSGFHGSNNKIRNEISFFMSFMIHEKLGPIPRLRWQQLWWLMNIWRTLLPLLSPLMVSFGWLDGFFPPHTNSWKASDSRSINIQKTLKNDYFFYFLALFCSSKSIAR